MAAPQIPLYTGNLPNRAQQEPQVFSNNINDWVTYQPDQITGTNTISTFVNGQAIAAETSANLAATSITTVNFKGSWSNLTGPIPDPATDPTTVYHGALFYVALSAIADVTLSEPGVTSDWALSAQTGNRVIISGPLTLEVPGRYYVVGNGTVTIPLPSTLSDGTVFNFANVPTDTPTIFVGTDLITTRRGLTDGIIMGSSVSKFEMMVRSGLYEV